MSLVCFASFKSSPGVTLTALATAAAWPTRDGRQKLLLEADADGGSLALRYQLPTRPGLISLAAGARRGLSHQQMWDHAQLLPGGLPVVLGPDGPEQAADVLRGSGRELGEWLAGLAGVDVIADVGRLSIGSPAMELARSADAILGVARPTAVQLQPAAQRMLALASLGPKVGWVLIGEKPYSARDVGDAYGLPVVHVVAEDPRGAGLLESGTSPNKLKRSTLVRSIAGLADVLAGWVHASEHSAAAPHSAPEANAADEATPPPPATNAIDAMPPPAPQAPPNTETWPEPVTGDGPPSLAILAAKRGQPVGPRATGQHADDSSLSDTQPPATQPTEPQPPELRSPDGAQALDHTQAFAPRVDL